MVHHRFLEPRGVARIHDIVHNGVHDLDPQGNNSPITICAYCSCAFLSLFSIMDPFSESIELVFYSVTGDCLMDVILESSHSGGATATTPTLVRPEASKRSF